MNRNLKKTFEEEIDQQTFSEYQRNQGQVNQTKARLSESQEALIREQVARLPREERLAIYLYFWESQTISEIAVTIDISTALVKKLIHNGLARLSKDLRSVSYGYRLLRTPYETESAA